MTKVTDIITKTYVDKDILYFLKAIYFGDFITDPLKAASNKAYLDMNRTIRFNGLPDATRMDLRIAVNSILESNISKLTSGSITNQSEFDFWHCEVCKQIINLYLEKDIKFTYGQAQKWINMTIKYLYMLEATSFDGIFEYLHIPIDNYVFDIAKKLLKIEKPKVAWSNWDDYDNQYLLYQNLIREKIDDGTPLRWEFRNWLKSSRNIK